MARSEVEPWIENVILSYDGSEQQQANRRLLKAYVVGLGHMSQSQAQTVQQQQGTTELIFLSDGVVQVPAILTVPALEDLQEREDRDTQSTLVDSTVRVQCRVDFYAHPQLDRSGFFLLVSKLATVAAGPHKGGSPPCTTLASVRQHLCKTWRLARRRNVVRVSQNSQQHGFELSELLWTWAHEALRDVQMDALTAMQPSTSSYNPAARHADARTSWEADRITYKSAGSFFIPVCHLLIPEPEEEAQRPLQVFDQVSREATNEILSPLDDSVRDGPPDHSQAVPQMANPWDAFSPPVETQLCTLPSRPDESIIPEDTAPNTPTDAAGITFQVERGPFLATSTQVSFRGSSDISQTSEQEQSSIHPYQKAPQPSPRSRPWYHGLSPNRPLNLSSRVKSRCSQISTSPPTRSTEEGTLSAAQTAVHSNGASFSYNDQCAAREQLLEELFKFEVSEGFLRWAVNYLKSDNI